MSVGREVSPSTQLRRAGVTDATRAQSLVAEIEALVGITLPDTPRAVSYLADPDLGLLQMLRLAESAQEYGNLDELRALAQSLAGARLAILLGASVALGDFLVRHPQYLSDFATWPESPSLSDLDARTRLLDAVGADPGANVPVASIGGAEGVTAMRIMYRRLLLRVAAIDLYEKTPTAIFPQVSQALSDLAGAALEAGLAIARADEPQHDKTRLAIIAMGKCGARELNYVSDVDVIYVAEPAEGVEDAASLAAATKLAMRAAQACSAPGAEVPLWEVDPNLRPEGRDGALVRNINSHRAYYERWAETWEFQALLKARPVAGDREVGAAYIDAVNPLVWKAVEREGFVESAQAMRRRVEENVPVGQADRQLKLGPGGLRDVEFTIQLLQLVHGRADESLHVTTTLDALAALRRGGYVGRTQAALMDSGYRQLRVWEHRLQLFRMQRTHLMPDTEEGMRRLARASGFATVEYMEEVWHDLRRAIRAAHLEMFYRPILPVMASLSADEASLNKEAALERLSAVGFADGEAAYRHIVALTEGVRRGAAIQRQLMPAMIGWFAAGADPDAGLLAFRQLSEQLRDSQWFLKLLRDSGNAAQRLARLLSTSGYVTQALLASAQDIAWLDNDEDLARRTRERLFQEADAILKRAEDAEQCITALRSIRRRELARTAAADVLGLIDSVEAAEAISDTADMLLHGGLRIAMVEVAKDLGREALDITFAVVAMGRYGGLEMGYTSDADVMFVYDGEGQEAFTQAQAVATKIRSLLQSPNVQPPLEVDATLRPEGKNGPLARSISSFAEYYQRWSDPWETQALLRARVAAGDEGLSERFTALIDGVRFPAEVTEAALKQIRTLKARMESERLPRGRDPRRHVKLGPGGLSDVEWVVQLLQLQHAHSTPSLRTPRTLEALQAAVAEGLMDPSDAETLDHSWRLATDIRGAIALRARSRDADMLPLENQELRVLAEIMGLSLTGAELEDEYARSSRHARGVTERLFYGWDDERTN